MKKYTILTEDGTTGITRLYTAPEPGQLVRLECRDENGIPFQHESYCDTVLDECDSALFPFCEGSKLAMKGETK